MKVQNNQTHNVSFGIKVPTKQLVDFMSGIRTEETNDVFLKLTGMTNEKMVSTMSPKIIEDSKKYCTNQITNSNPVFKKLTELKDNLLNYLPKAAYAKNGGHLREILKLSDAKDAEKANLLKTLPETIDISEIKLPL